MDCKLKKTKNFFSCALAGALTFSVCLTAGADGTENAGILKSGLLLNERNNYQYNIFDYNTNDDQNVNVLDLCRLKASALEKYENPSVDKLSFSMDNAELSSDGNRLRIPVYMQMNTTGLYSVNAIVKYDTDKFSLTGVTQGDFSGYGYVGGNRDNAVFNTFNNQNIYENSGVIAYLEFDINGGTGSGVYEFKLTDIKAYYSENWNRHEVPQDKRNDRSEVYRYSFESGSVTTTVTEQTTVTTTVTTTAPADTTTAVTTTTPWEPPVTTTTTTPWEPPVITTTTTPWEPPVTTTEQTQGDYMLSDEQQWFIDEVNKFRTSNGKSGITVIKKAFKAADERAEMLSRSFTVDLPDGRNYKWALYDNDIMPYCISQYINNTASTKEQAFSSYLSSSKSYLLDDSMYDRFAVGHYTDRSGRNYWAMFTFG